LHVALAPGRPGTRRILTNLRLFITRPIIETRRLRYVLVEEARPALDGSCLRLFFGPSTYGSRFCRVDCGKLIHFGGPRLWFAAILPSGEFTKAVIRRSAAFHGPRRSVSAARQRPTAPSRSAEQSVQAHPDEPPRSNSSSLSLRARTAGPSYRQQITLTWPHPPDGRARTTSTREAYCRAHRPDLSPTHSDPVEASSATGERGPSAWSETAAARRSVGLDRQGVRPVSAAFGGSLASYSHPGGPGLPFLAASAPIDIPSRTPLPILSSGRLVVWDRPVAPPARRPEPA